jgi:hypothetical protein
MTRDETRYIPQYARPVMGGRKPFRHEVIADRKERFASLLKYVTARNGWLTSIPGDRDVEMQCLPGSSLPDELRKLGYDVREDGETQRILHTAIEERLVRADDGSLLPLTPGSTLPVALVVQHAGIVKVERYRFDIP